MTTKHETERAARWAFQNAFNAVQGKGPWLAVVWRVVDGKVEMGMRTTHAFPTDQFEEAMKQLERNIDGALGMLPDDPLPEANLMGVYPVQNALSLEELAINMTKARKPLQGRPGGDAILPLITPPRPISSDTKTDIVTESLEPDQENDLPPLPSAHPLPEPCNAIKVDINCEATDSGEPTK